MDAKTRAAAIADELLGHVYEERCDLAPDQRVYPNMWITYPVCPHCEAYGPHEPYSIGKSRVTCEHCHRSYTVHIKEYGR